MAISASTVGRLLNTGRRLEKNVMLTKPQKVKFTSNLHGSPFVVEDA